MQRGFVKVAALDIDVGSCLYQELYQLFSARLHSCQEVGRCSVVDYAEGRHILPWETCL